MIHELCDGDSPHTHTHTHTRTHTHTVQLIVATLPGVYVEKMLRFLGNQLESSPHLGFYLHWCVELLTRHTAYLKGKAPAIMAQVRDLQKSVLQKQSELGKMYVVLHVCV